MYSDPFDSRYDDITRYHGSFNTHTATRAELAKQVAELTARQSRPVMIPTRTHHEITGGVNAVISLTATVVLFATLALLGGHIPTAALAGIIAGIYVTAHNLINNHRGDRRVTMTRARARALAQLDELPDQDVIEVVGLYTSAKAAEKAQRITDAWDAYDRHSRSPIAQLDPDSWNARRRELTKALTDLGEKVPSDE